MRHLLGLSLSFCMSDILNDRVDPDDIIAIVSSTAFNTVDEAFAYYYDHYWNKYAEGDVRSVLRYIWPILFQPRLVHGCKNDTGHNISKGWWLDTHTGELSKIVKS